MQYFNTPLIQLLDIQYPIMQAPMAGGITTDEMVIEVCNFGALGSIGAGYMNPSSLDKAIRNIKKSTNTPFNVNLFIPSYAEAHPSSLNAMKNILTPIAQKLGITLTLPTNPYTPNFDEQLDVILDHKVRILSFTFGVLEEQYVKKLKREGVLIIGTATSHQEAKELEKSGVDFIVAQGKEAGGHRGTFLGDPLESLVPTFSLVEDLKAHTNTPIIAAGGIMNGEDLHKCLQKGACGASLGTYFLPSFESGICDAYKQLLVEQENDQTTLTKAFTGKYARAIQNKFIKEMESCQSDFLDYPIQHLMTGALRKKASQKGDTNYMSLWAGQRAFLCKKMPCNELLKKLIEECISSSQSF